MSKYFTEPQPDDDEVVTKGFLRETLKREFSEFGTSIAVTLQTILEELREFKKEMYEFRTEMYEFKNEMYEFKDEMNEFRDEMKMFQKETKTELKALRVEADINKRALGSLLN